ncbi:MAG: NAD+ synthase [Planctomycetota bacterium]
MRIALAQTNPTVGDLEGNALAMIDAAHRAAELSADVVVFPELAVCGYPPRDLLFRSGFVEGCVLTAERVAEACRTGPTLIIGTPAPSSARSGATANALLVFRGGRVVDRYEKRLLPEYDVFDERRYFEPGTSPTVIEIAGTRCGLAICEDLWHGEDAGTADRYRGQGDPIAELVSSGAQAILVPSASPFVLGKHARHMDILRRHAQRHGVPVVSVNQAGANDDLVFDGRSCAVSPEGKSLGSCAAFSDDLVVLDLDAAGPTETTPRDGMLDLFEALVLGIRDYGRKSGFRGACLGVSGGIDSALVAAIAVRAFGPEAVLGVSMPGKYSSDHSRTDAHELCERLGIRLLSGPIAEPFDGFTRAVDPLLTEIGQDALGATLPDLAEENLQSRVRGTLMMTLSNRTGQLLLTTGNKSELAVGYGTLYGDMNGGLAVIGDVPKTMVFDLCRWINEHHALAGFAEPPIPETIISKEPSAELAPGQRDTDSLPPYEVLDEIVERFVDREQSRDEIARAVPALDRAEIDRVCGMIERNEYKRYQLALTLKVLPRAFGPGRRVPLVHRWR